MGEREIVAIICLAFLFGVIAAGVWLLDLLSSEVQGDLQGDTGGFTGGYGGIQGDTPPSAPAQAPARRATRTRKGKRRDA